MDYKLEVAKSIVLDGVSVEDIYALVTLPKDLNNGDYCIPCFKFAKMLGKSPMLIAENIKNTVMSNPLFSKVEAVAGYVNFSLNKNLYIKEVLDKVSTQGGNYGKSELGKGKTVLIDYSSVNIAKPFHMGHFFNTTIGATLYRTYKSLGYNTVGINHLGDWGTQFGKLIVAYKLWGNRKDIEERGVRGLLDIYVKFHNEAEKDENLNEQARMWFKKIEDGDKESVELWQWFKEITLEEVEKVYKRLNVKFDSYAGESFYNDKMDSVLDELRAKNLLEESQGAQIVNVGDDMPPCLLVRADGATLYATRDMAAAFYRKNTYNFDKCLYVVAYQQNLHFKQFFKVIELMGYEWYKDLVHVAHGMISLEDGSMSTRSGNVVFLSDALDMARDKALAIINEKNAQLQDKESIAEQIGICASVFAVLQSGRIKDMTFSFDRALSFEGETGPYVLYTYTRCCSLIEKAGQVGEECDMSVLDNTDCHELAKLIDKYPSVVEDVAQRYEPSFLTRYVIDLAKAFNKYYFDYKINDGSDKEKCAKMLMVKSVKRVIENTMSLLGLTLPTKM